MQSRVDQLEEQLSDLNEEVEVLSSNLAGLREQVARLERRADRASRAARSSETGSTSSEVNEAGASTGVAGNGYPPRSPSVASTGGTSGTQSVPTWIEREEICDQIGAFLLRALSGDYRSTSGRDLIPLPSRVWVVIQDIEGNRYDPVKVFRTWAPAKALVKRGSSAGDSIFVGLPSERGARRVVHAATLRWPADQ